MFLKFDQYRVLYLLFYSKLVGCIIFNITEWQVCFVKDRGMCGRGERNIQISACYSEVSQILPHFTLMTRERYDAVSYQVWRALSNISQE